MSDLKSYCGFVAIVGRSNVGKSTLLNQLLGQKVSITANKPQTTRHRILGIETSGAYQTLYVDTPGIHAAAPRLLNRLMNRTASRAVRDVDLIIFVVEGTHWGSDDELVLTQLQQVRCPVLLAINKIDQLRCKQVLLPHLSLLSQKRDFLDMVPLCAEQGEQVDTIAAIVRQHLPTSSHYFPENDVTDRSQRFMVAEIIREKLIRFLGDELPHVVTVEIEQFATDPRGHHTIHGLIWVEREGQKKMVIGAQGQKIKIIGRAARLDIEQLLTARVHLELWVKVKSGWANDQRALLSLGYSDD